MLETFSGNVNPQQKLKGLKGVLEFYDILRVCELFL